MCLALATIGGLLSCQKASTSGAAPSASSSAVASAASGGPCATYARRLCEKTGPDSPTCQAITTATELMPPDACTAGLKDVEYSVKKLALAGKACDELVDKLCAAVGPHTQSCELVKKETKNFPPEKCKMMEQHLPEVVAELQKMEQANLPLSQELQAALVQGGVATFGPANAKVQIVEFSDFQCPFCSRAASVVHQIKEKYGSRVRFTFRQFPLPMHPNAHDAAEAALAANTQGKFWEFHDKLFEHQKQLDRAGLEEQAKESGLNLVSFKKALDDHKFAAAVDADVKLGEQVQVQGTPSMFINGARVADPTSFEAVSELIEAALKGPVPG
jgi:protein-disulfide isomerase